MNQKISRVLKIGFCLLLFCGCSTKKDVSAVPEETPEPVSEEVSEKEEDEMTDLTFMSGTALYSMVLNMVSDPVHYDGQTVRVRGYFAEGKDADGNTVYGCVIPDATACCQQGFLLNLIDTEYPESGQWFEVEGTFRYRLKEFSTDIILDDARIIRVLTD